MQRLKAPTPHGLNKGKTMLSHPFLYKINDQAYNISKIKTDYERIQEIRPPPPFPLPLQTQQLTLTYLFCYLEFCLSVFGHQVK